MKSTNILLKSLLMALLLSQSTAQAWNWNDISKTVSAFWQSNKTLIVGLSASIFALGGYLWLKPLLKSKSVSPTIKKKKHDNTPKVLIAETYSISRALASSRPQVSKEDTDAARQQACFLEKYFRIDEEYIQTDEMEIIFSSSVNILRDFINKNKLNFAQFHLRAIGTSMISRVSLETKLIKEAQDAVVQNGDHQYKAMKIDRNCFAFDTIVHSTKKDGKLPIIRITTAKGDHIFVTKAGNERFKNSFELLDYVCFIEKNIIIANAKKAVATLPIINLSQEVDISWLDSMLLGARPLGQAKQHVTLSLDNTAAPKRFAPAAPTERDAEHEQRQEIVINDNFIVWVKGRGAVLPLLAAYIPANSWHKA